MENSTEIAYFVLAAYGSIGHLKYLYFCIMLLWYVSICAANAFFILIIYVDRRLHEPMYILLCNLFVNEIGGSTSLYPLMLSQMFSDTHKVTLSWCFLQLCSIYTSAAVEFCTLAAMAYDRYVAICYPLQYSVIMNTGRAGKIVLLVWMYSIINISLLLSFVVHLKFCGNVIDKVFCDHHLIAQLACSISVFDKLSDLFFAFFTMAFPFSLILFSYMKIFVVCLSITTKENTQKAVSTCTPQIISVSNLFIGCIFNIVDSRFEVKLLPGKVRVILSVYLLIFQPMITPFMYGYTLPKIRQSCKRFILKKK